MDRVDRHSVALDILIAGMLIVDIIGASCCGVSLAFVPLVTLLLVLAASRMLRPPLWLQALVLATLLLGILPLAREELSAGLRAIARMYISLGLAWTLFASADQRMRRTAKTTLGIVCLGIMLWTALLGSTRASAGLSEARVALLLCLTAPFAVELLMRKLYVWVPGFCVVYVACVRHAALLLCGFTGMLTSMLLREGRRNRLLALFCVLAIGIALAIAGRPIWDQMVLVPVRDEAGQLKCLYIQYQALPSAVAASPVCGHGFGRYREVIAHYFVRSAEAKDRPLRPDTESTYAVAAVEAGTPYAALLLLLLLYMFWACIRRVGHDPEAPLAAGSVLVLAVAGFFAELFTDHTAILTGCILGLAAGVLPAPKRPASAWLRRCALPVAVAIACVVVVWFEVTPERIKSHVSSLLSTRPAPTDQPPR